LHSTAFQQKGNAQFIGLKIGWPDNGTLVINGNINGCSGDWVLVINNSNIGDLF
jgi:hypothetical protein